MAVSVNIPSSIKVLNPYPLDYWRGPWADVADALVNVPEGVRFDGLTVKITGLGEYWWLAADLTDTGLIVKSTSLPIILDGDTLADARTSGYDDYGGIFLGDNAGFNATNATNSTFIGESAGSGATNADNSNFFGYRAGFGADSSPSSNFFGNGAGDGATNAAYSNFFGLGAGGNATNAGRSNLFGYSVGRSFTGNNIGANNIIIGTNISLPNATSDAMNLGGVLFGKNFYNTTTGDPSITPVAQGNIGIGVVSPSARLHLAAGTATANTAPLKFTSGTALTVPVDGAVEYHSSHLYFTIGSTRYQLDQQSGGSGLTVGTSTITSGTNTRVLYNNSGVLGEYTVSGSGNVAMTTSPTFTTPDLGTPSALVGTNITGTATGLTSGITNALKSATTTVDVSAATAPTSGQVLTATSGTAATWQTPASATGAWLLASGGTATGTNTFAMGSNPFILTSGVTTGTGATAGIQNVFNSLTTGIGYDLSSSSATTGFLKKITSTSTVINHTAGTHGLFGIQSSGANSTSAKTVIGQSSIVTNTGTTSTNVAGYFSASGATNNYGLLVNGRVGFGINVPESAFHLYENSVDGSGMLIQNAGATGSTPRALFFQGGSTAYSIAAWQNSSVFEGQGTGGFFVGAYAGDLKLSTGTSRNTRLKIANSSGDVVIGSSVLATTPAAKLEVQGNGTTTGLNFRTGNSSGTSRFEVNDAGTALFTSTTGNLGLFTSSFGTSAARVLALANGTAPATSIADGIQIWAADSNSSSELWVRTESGAVVNISGLLPPVTESGTSFSLNETHRNRVVICSNSGVVTVTVGTGKASGWNCILLATHATGTITLSASGTTLNGTTATTTQFETLSLVHYGSEAYLSKLG